MTHKSALQIVLLASLTFSAVIAQGILFTVRRLVSHKTCLFYFLENQGRIKTNLGLMLLPRKRPIFLDIQDRPRCLRALAACDVTTFYRTHYHNLTTYRVSQKVASWGFLAFFPKGWNFFTKCYVPVTRSYLR